MMQDRPFYISQLIQQHLKGELSPEDAATLKAWLAEAPENEALLRSLSNETLISTELQRMSRFSEEDGRRRVEEKLLAAKRRTHMVRFRMAAAAAVLLLIGTGIYLIQQRMYHADEVAVVNDIAPGGDKAVLTLADGSKVTLDSSGNQVIRQGSTAVKHNGGQLLYESHNNNDAVSYNILTTPRGGQFRLTLPDGSKVWLNAMSSIRFPTVFSGKQRSVVVTGEAYFEVAEDATKPFIVKVNNQTDIEVLGTHFNVNAYADESTLETTLLQGAVRVQGITMKPGQQVKIGKGADVKVLNDVNTDQVTAWKNGAFNFDDKTLPEVMRQLSRWYDVDVRYEGIIPVKVFAGEMGRSLNLSQCLAVLEKMGVHFRIEGRTLIVMQ